MSLAKTTFFNVFKIQGTAEPYVLKACAGFISTIGALIASIVESLSGNISIPLRTLIKCNHMPDNRDEIPTPEAATNHYHMRVIAAEFSRYFQSSLGASAV